MDEIILYRAVLIGAGIAVGLLALTGIYVKVKSPFQLWIASLRTKSLFRKDRRKQVRRPGKE